MHSGESTFICRLTKKGDAEEGYGVSTGAFIGAEGRTSQACSMALDHCNGGKLCIENHLHINGK